MQGSHMAHDIKCPDCFSSVLSLSHSTSDIGYPFKSALGVLIGDTTSPDLWLLYFANFAIPPSHDDTDLGGIHVCHLEQADDILLDQC